MRLWSLHPKYLDSKGIVALWREALLCQKVLKGETKGYTKHPQLNRFKNIQQQQQQQPLPLLLQQQESSSSSLPSITRENNDDTTGNTVATPPVELQAISYYLTHVHTEATERSYKFDVSKISVQVNARWAGTIPVTLGQIRYEMKHLLHKLRIRDQKRFLNLVNGSNSSSSSSSSTTTGKKEESEDASDDNEQKKKGIDDDDDLTLEKAQALIDKYIDSNEIEAHPLFHIVEGDVEAWEKIESFSGSQDSQSPSPSPSPQKKKPRKNETGDNNSSKRRTSGKRALAQQLEDRLQQEQSDISPTTTTMRRRRARKDRRDSGTSVPSDASPSKKPKRMT